MATPLSDSVETVVCSTLPPDLSSIDDPKVLRGIIIEIYDKHLQLEKDFTALQKSYIDGMERELGLLERCKKLEAENRALSEKLSKLQASLDLANKFFEA
jgi:hypothetical protein